MKKIKIVTMLIVAMFVGLGATSASGIEYLNADINVKVTNFFGLVSPIINQTAENQKNQSGITFEVNVNETDVEPRNHTYVVNDTLIINLNINDETGRENFLFPRWVFYRVVIARDLGVAFNLPGKMGNLFSRWLPVKVPLGSVGVVDTLSGAKANNISIPIRYRLDNITFYSTEGENLTMYITVMGFFPGDTNGSLGPLPIINRKVVNLVEVKYKDDISHL